MGKTTAVLLVAIVVLTVLAAGCLQGNQAAASRASCAQLNGTLCEKGEACVGNGVLAKDSSPSKSCCVGRCVVPGAATARPTQAATATPAPTVAPTPTPAVTGTPAATENPSPEEPSVSATPEQPTPTPTGEVTATPTPTEEATPTPQVCVADMEPCTAGATPCCTTSFSCQLYGQPDIYGQRRSYCIAAPTPTPTPSPTPQSCVQDYSECSRTGSRCCSSGFSCQLAVSRYLCQPAAATPTPTPTPTAYPCPSGYTCAENAPRAGCQSIVNQPSTCRLGQDAYCWKCYFQCPAPYECLPENHPLVQCDACDLMPNQPDVCWSGNSVRWGCFDCDDSC